MKIDEHGTTIEPGDPGHVGFSTGNCALCGADLAETDKVTAGGHLHTPLGERLSRLLFAACSTHYEQARAKLVRHEHNKKDGYQGEWEPKFGLLAQVHYVDAPAKTIRLI